MKANRARSRWSWRLGALVACALASAGPLAQQAAPPDDIDDPDLAASAVDDAANDVDTATPAADAGAGADTAAKDAEEAEVRQRLEAVREQQRALAAERDGTKGEVAGLADSLRDHELRIAAIARALRGFDEAIAARQQDIAKLEDDERVAQRRLDRQRDEIAALLRSAYALGRHDQLRLVFAPEQVRDVARMLAYHQYLERDRRARVTALARDLAVLADVRRALERANEALVAAKASQAAEAERLAQAKVAQAESLAALEARLADQSQRLAALGKDEASLVALIERLRDAIADIPRQLAGGEPFASRRGRVPWPVAGSVLQRFGATGADGRAATGILLSAKAGDPVKAVSHGRVAYADWLQGYGLLLILDHGDGYLTLYGHNESLLKDVGDWADAGEAIATVGASGGRRDAGVYFELRQRGRPLDPTTWLLRKK